MTGDPVPPDVHRFLLTSALSVPHIETILLMRREPTSWASALVGKRYNARLAESWRMECRTGAL